MSGSASDPVGVGIIGAGFISDIYLANLTSRFPNVRVIAIADMFVDRARDRAAKYGIEALSVEDLLRHRDVELVVNLTVPVAHYPVAKQVLEAGKSVYNEKPLTETREQGRDLLALATQQGVLVGGAPDTFLGGGLQTARQLIDEGTIGLPIAATAVMYSHGHEHWHPDPAFYYQPGAGPMLDMGPYYVTALVSLLGPIARVASMTNISFPERTITSQPKAGEVITVTTPTHIAATLEFVTGAIGTITTSFDVYETLHSGLVIYGTEGTLRLPDPNTFGGSITVLQPEAFKAKRDPLSMGRTPDDKADPNRADQPEWETVPLTHGYTDNARGLGVADLAHAIRTGTPARASGELALHVLDIMHATLESSDLGRHVTIDSTVLRPAALAAGESFA
jgi:predicted dehydrogenase